MLSYSHSPGHHKIIPTSPAIIATINTLAKSDGIQNLKITDLCRHLLFDSSVYVALIARVDDTDDKDTPLQECMMKTLPLQIACTQHHRCDKYR